ncbi:glycosyltransferase [Salegentibacter sp. BDJ18]|uniref:glycosyltransferase n=1 Tax=Salegentibacter sp. BDJ18 TaxID=2816376 RepID=UPI001AAF6DE0|nr:glycosyltransferase [Salegentibacter sp. BDJ18]MBO2544295.1 glycosyltransferase [Salegentibacter sp. BDJ18]
MAQVVIYSFLDVFYYSFYIEGFYTLYGKKNVRFSYGEFPQFADRSLVAIIESGGNKINLIIDANDTPKITPELLKWCDIYGKVNFHKEYILAQGQHKIIPISPNFGVRTWDLLGTINLSILNYWKSKERIISKKKFFANYWRQYKRLPLSAFKQSTHSNRNFVYFISSLWEKERATNQSRSNFIVACKELNGLEFEGGFAPRSDRKKTGFEELIDKRIGFENYVEKIEYSIVVFNTPAVEHCHGWKLAEFLALGKAIISTKHINELQAPLIHGEHIHYTSGEKDDVKKAIQILIEDEEYRLLLERNARKYFEDHIHPEAVLRYLLKFDEGC